MTAEQLEELLASCELVDHENYSPEFEKLHRIAPSLARRVIAAEKLVEAAENLVIGIGMGWDVGEMQIILDEAATAYREASK